MDTPAPRYAACELPGDLDLPPLPSPAPARGIVVFRDDHHRLSVRSLDLATLGEFSVDFRSAAFSRRLAEGKRGLLGRAVGLAKGETPLVWDPTAGFGRDAAQMAALGATVVAFERDPVVRALLEDALARVVEEPDEFAHALRERLSIRSDDARTALGNPGAEAPDVVYLDPMFPDRKGAALAKKDAQWLQALVGEGGDDDEEKELFEAARSAGPRRIVVKRPRHAPPIVPAPERNHRFEGKSVRYDLYL